MHCIMHVYYGVRYLNYGLNYLVEMFGYLINRSDSEDIMADEESDKIRRIARNALNRVTFHNDKALVCTMCMYVCEM